MPDRLTLEMTHVLAAAPAVVFTAFSDPDQLRKWWGPQGFTTPSLDFDPQVGKSYRIEMQPPEGDAFYLTGEFLEVEPAAHLAYTFVWEIPDPDDVETEVHLSFRERGGSTEVGLRQGDFKTEGRYALHHEGWSDCFEKLEGLLAGRTPSEVVRAGYDAWNTGDLEAFLEYVHPELVWTTSGLFPGLQPTYSGREGIRAFWEEFQEPWDSFEIKIEEMVELDPESMLIRVRFHVKGREMIELERRITNHIVVRDEMLYRFRGYDDWDQAIADLGIEDPRGAEGAQS